MFISVLYFRNTEKFDSLLSLLIPEESLTEGGKGDESKCKENVQGNEGDIVSNMKETLRETEEVIVKMKGTATSTEKVTQDETKSRKSSIGFKKEKDVLVIVEELRTLRDHQADLITQLMTELSYMEKENVLLKSQVGTGSVFYCRDIQSLHRAILSRMSVVKYSSNSLVIVQYHC